MMQTKDKISRSVPIEKFNTEESVDLVCVPGGKVWSSLLNRMYIR